MAIGSVSLARDVYHPPDLGDLTPDAREWYLAGVANANQDLAAFGPIAETIAQGGDANVPL